MTREWTFALEEGCKVITPIVRIGRARDLPDQLRLFDAFDFTDDSAYGSTFERLLIKLRDPPSPLANLIGVPALPPHLLRRPDRLAEIKSALRADFLRPVGITAQALRPTRMSCRHQDKCPDIPRLILDLPLCHPAPMREAPIGSSGLQGCPGLEPGFLPAAAIVAAGLGQLAHRFVWSPSTP